MQTLWTVGKESEELLRLRSLFLYGYIDLSAYFFLDDKHVDVDFTYGNNVRDVVLMFH